MPVEHMSQISHVADIHTSRLDLIAITPLALHCEAAAAPEYRAQLGQILDAEVPASWPVEHWEPHVFDWLLNQIAADPRVIGWTRYVSLRDPVTGSRTLIGTFGSLYPGETSRQIEVGYGILPEYRRRGYASEAMEAMLAWIQSFFPARCFVAQTFPHLAPSIGVLEKTGFTFVGPGFEEGTILYRRDCASASEPAFTPHPPRADNET